MRKLGERVLDPSRHRNAWRVVTVEGDGTRRHRNFPTEAQAIIYAGERRKALAASCARSVEDAVSEYQTHMLAVGLKDATIEQNLYRLGVFLGDQGVQLRSWTPAKVAERYRALTAPDARVIDESTTAAFSVATHQAFLIAAKTFFSFCTGRGWLAVDPAAKVRKVGRKARGKTQLRIDEVRHWEALALAYAEAGEAGALAALLTFYMAMRASEVTGLHVRDIDDDASAIVIEGAKTEAGDRRIDVPDVLRPLLAALVAERAGDELLFGSHWRDWPRLWVQRICREAGVPEVSAHGMRGLYASISMQIKRDPNALAEFMGHASSSVTMQHYAAPDAVARGAAGAVLKVLNGGKQ